MNEREVFLAMLKRCGITPLSEDSSTIVLEGGVGEVSGYAGFQAHFDFTESGDLKSVSIGE